LAVARSRMSCSDSFRHADAVPSTVRDRSSFLIATSCPDSVRGLHADAIVDVALLSTSKSSETGVLPSSSYSLIVPDLSTSLGSFVPLSTISRASSGSVGIVWAWQPECFAEERTKDRYVDSENTDERFANTLRRH
ncbi:hypothetical protein KCU83_g582, partial [Aureobasidium melanogenum]